MQQVVWPMITVRVERSVFVKRKKDASATPVITPGRMIGSVTAKLTASRPKNRWRANANAILVPSSSASAVEATAIRTDSHAASFGTGSLNSLPNQRVEKPGNGHELMAVSLNA